MKECGFRNCRERIPERSKSGRVRKYCSKGCAAKEHAAVKWDRRNPAEEVTVREYGARAGSVPAEPFRRLLERVHAEVQKDPEIKDPMRQLGWMIFRTESEDLGTYRTLYRLLDRREGGITRQRKDRNRPRVAFEPHCLRTISFDLADLIVCRTVGAQAWHTDPDLAAIFGEVDLSAIDLLEPVSEDTHRQAAERVAEVYADSGNLREASDRLGVSVGVVSRLLKDAKVAA